MTQLTADQQLDLAKREEAYLCDQRAKCTCGYHGYALNIPFGDPAIAKIEQCYWSIKPFRIRMRDGRMVDGYGNPA